MIMSVDSVHRQEGCWKCSWIKVLINIRVYSALIMGITCFRPETGQNSTMVLASHILPPLATRRICPVLLLICPLRRSIPGGKTKKSASFPGERDPRDENKPSVFAPDAVAAKRTYNNKIMVKICIYHKFDTHFVIAEPSCGKKVHFSEVVQPNGWFPMSTNVCYQTLSYHRGSRSRSVVKCKR